MSNKGLAPSAVKIVENLQYTTLTRNTLIYSLLCNKHSVWPCMRPSNQKQRFPPQPQQVTAPPSGHVYTSLCSCLPPSISVSLSGVSLCVSVPVGSSAMLNAPFSSLPRQELICEIIYLPVYFKHWEDTLLIAPTLYSIYAGCERAFRSNLSTSQPIIMCAYHRLD